MMKLARNKLSKLDKFSCQFTKREAIDIMARYDLQMHDVKQETGEQTREFGPRNITYYVTGLGDYLSTAMEKK
jgi:hypothetical protein